MIHDVIAWYGDPEFADVPLADLLSPAYAEERRGLVGDTASAELRPGSPGGREARLPEPVSGAAAVSVVVGPIATDGTTSGRAERIGFPPEFHI